MKNKGIRLKVANPGDVDFLTNQFLHFMNSGMPVTFLVLVAPYFKIGLICHLIQIQNQRLEKVFRISTEII